MFDIQPFVRTVELLLLLSAFSLFGINKRVLYVVIVVSVLLYKFFFLYFSPCTAFNAIMEHTLEVKILFKKKRRNTTFFFFTSHLLFHGFFLQFFFKLKTKKKFN